MFCKLCSLRKSYNQAAHDPCKDVTIIQGDLRMRCGTGESVVCVHSKLALCIKLCLPQILTGSAVWSQSTSHVCASALARCTQTPMHSLRNCCHISMHLWTKHMSECRSVMPLHNAELHLMGRLDDVPLGNGEAV